MAPRGTTGYQRQTAQRNVTAILDAAEELIRLHGQTNISAVAVQAGVSRVTVYAHFPTWEALLEATVERAVSQVMSALAALRPEDGPPAAALDRLIAGAWQHLARYQGMAATVAELLSPDAISRTHAAAHQAIASLLARGQADGSFRADLPAGWLTEACIALMHTCADGVRAGRVDPAEAGRILTASVHALFTTTKEPACPVR